MIKHLVAWNNILWQFSQVYSQFITNKNHASSLFKRHILINFNKLIYNLKNKHKICYCIKIIFRKKVFVHVKSSMIEPFLICETILFSITLNFKVQNHCIWIKVMQCLNFFFYGYKDQKFIYACVLILRMNSNTCSLCKF